MCVCVCRCVGVCIFVWVCVRLIYHSQTLFKSGIEHILISSFLCNVFNSLLFNIILIHILLYLTCFRLEAVYKLVFMLRHAESN